MTNWTPASALAAAMLAISALWISGGAATALIGAFLPRARVAEVAPDWMPRTRTALLFTLCGEDPAGLAIHLRGLTTDLHKRGLAQASRVFVLSDTFEQDAIAREEKALAALTSSGAVSYRRRPSNEGRKPANIADWFATSGHVFDHMLVLDADSRMSASRIRTMIWSMETRPRLGLLQAGIALVPGKSRFARHHRLSARLLSPIFLTGFTATTGSTANYWGHNAIIRTAAFRSALDLPVLSGKAPMGGPILSHDFIEAAWIRRAGWDVTIDPAVDGSGEGAPQTVGEFSRRDRRWCQGNLQHIRLLAEPGLHLLSRVHLLFGMVSYLAAPIWLALLVLLTSGLVTLGNAWPMVPVLILLLIPKLSAFARMWVRMRSTASRLLTSQAFLGELVVSTILAPIVMVRQTGAVIAVLMGRDCGWKSPTKARLRLPSGVADMLVAAALLVLAAFGQTGATWWLMPVLGPLLFAPLIIRKLDEPA